MDHLTALGMPKTGPAGTPTQARAFDLDEHGDDQPAFDEELAALDADGTTLSARDDGETPAEVALPAATPGPIAPRVPAERTLTAAVVEQIPGSEDTVTPTDGVVSGASSDSEVSVAAVAALPTEAIAQTEEGSDAAALSTQTAPTDGAALQIQPTQAVISANSLPQDRPQDSSVPAEVDRAAVDVTARTAALPVEPTRTATLPVDAPPSQPPAPSINADQLTSKTAAHTPVSVPGVPVQGAETVARASAAERSPVEGAEPEKTVLRPELEQKTGRPADKGPSRSAPAPAEAAQNPRAESVSRGPEPSRRDVQTADTIAVQGSANAPANAAAISTTASAWFQPVAQQAVRTPQSELLPLDAALSEMDALLPQATGADGARIAGAERAFSTVLGAEPRMVARQVAEAFVALREGTVDIRLHPEELGRVSLSMSQGEGGLIVQLSADRPETLELLRRNIAMLGDEFSALGLGTASFTFAGSEQGTGQQDAILDGTAIGAAEGELVEADPSLLTQTTLLNPSMASGRLDIRL